MTDLSTAPLDTKSVLHPRQVAELTESRAKLRKMLNQPDFITGQLQDGGAMIDKQLRATDKLLAQAPQPYEADEIDAAVKLEAELRDKWLQGMPTQAEMRRNVAGAVDKNMAWDRRNKDKVLAWKTIRRRLHASGVSDHGLAEENDISNIEMFRPVGGVQELNMHNAQIPGQQFHFPPGGIARAEVMSDAQSEALKIIDPEIHGRMALLDAPQRAEVLKLMDRVLESSNEPPTPVKKPQLPNAFVALKREAIALGINTHRMKAADLQKAIAEAKQSQEG